ncbi:hypothetical protein RCH22_002766 [Cryobacterium psychrotolerans]|nr:hypothetical protein [Cryobacterium psychrotolerans]
MAIEAIWSPVSLAIGFATSLRPGWDLPLDADLALPRKIVVFLVLPFLCFCQARRDLENIAETVEPVHRQRIGIS